MSFEDRIFNRRIELGLTLEEIAAKVGVAASTISRWESGEIKNQRRDKIAALARALDTTPAYLMGWNETTDNIPSGSVETMPAMRKVPMFDEKSYSQTAPGEIKSHLFVDMPEHIQADFALRCRGNSMTGARLFDGDIVYIKRQQDVQNGEIAAVLIDGEPILKRVRKYQNSVVLQPENSDYEPIIYIGDEVQSMHILGKAIAYTSIIK